MGIDITTIINQHSPKAWIEMSNALLTPVVAIFGAFIAFQQWQISKTLEAFQVVQHKYDNYVIPLKKLGKNYIDKLTSKDESIDKKLLTLECIDEICSISEKNFYMFVDEDYDILVEVCDDLRKTTKKVKSIKELSLKEIWDITVSYFNNLAILISILLVYMPSKNKSYINIFDILENLLIGFIAFFTPHWVCKKFTKTFIPRILLVYIIFGILFEFILPWKRKKRKRKTEKEVVNESTQSEQLHLLDNTSKV